MTQPRYPRLRRGVLEFVAIFLAVSMGFVAEAWRESLREGRDVELVMLGLVADLDQDLAEIDGKIRTDSASWSHGQWLHANWERPNLPLDSIDMAIASLYRGGPYSPVRSEYESAKSSGYLRSFPDDSLRSLTVFVYENRQVHNREVAEMSNDFDFRLWDALDRYVTFAPFSAAGRAEVSIGASWPEAQGDRVLRNALVRTVRFRGMHSRQLRDLHSVELRLRDALAAEIGGG